MHIYSDILNDIDLLANKYWGYYTTNVGISLNITFDFYNMHNLFANYKDFVVHNVVVVRILVLILRSIANDSQEVKSKYYFEITYVPQDLFALNNAKILVI